MKTTFPTAAPGEAGGGTEASGGSYARINCEFDVASGGSASNTNQEDFPTATGNWGTITHFALFDASTSGNMLIYGTWDTSKTINTNDIFRLPVGNLTITAA